MIFEVRAKGPWCVLCVFLLYFRYLANMARGRQNDQVSLPTCSFPFVNRFLWGNNQVLQLWRTVTDALKKHREHDWPGSTKCLLKVVGRLLRGAWRSSEPLMHAEAETSLWEPEPEPRARALELQSQSAWQRHSHQRLEAEPQSHRAQSRLLRAVMP